MSATDPVVPVSDTVGAPSQCRLKTGSPEREDSHLSLAGVPGMSATDPVVVDIDQKEAPKKTRFKETKDGDIVHIDRETHVDQPSLIKHATSSLVCVQDDL